jgi:hypothetical protein
MAMSEEKLLIAFDATAFLYDLANPEAEPMTIGMPETYGFVEDVIFAQDFTKDGLLLIPSDDTAAQGVQRFIKLIVDLKTGQKLEFNHQLTYNREDYHYDDVSGNLIHRNSNAFTVQRRGADGNFEVVYTITPKHNDMELNAAGHATDGTWLVLQNDEYCEIYRLEDGTLWYVLAKPQDRSSQLAVIDGKLYDFCLGGEPLAIELPTTDQAREYIRDALVYEGVHRTLSDLEMEEYYIPDSWREG